MYISMLALVPGMVWAQSPETELQHPPEADGSRTHLPVRQAGAGVLWDAPNALTMQVIMAQRPSSISAQQWRKMMLEPVNASLYPIRLSQGMLDTLDATQLDLRYRYVMSTGNQIREHEEH